MRMRANFAGLLCWASLILCVPVAGHAAPNLSGKMCGQLSAGSVWVVFHPQASIHGQVQRTPAWMQQFAAAACDSPEFKDTRHRRVLVPEETLIAHHQLHQVVLLGEPCAPQPVVALYGPLDKFLSDQTTHARDTIRAARESLEAICGKRPSDLKVFVHKRTIVSDPNPPRGKRRGPPPMTSTLEVLYEGRFLRSEKYGDTFIDKDPLQRAASVERDWNAYRNSPQGRRDRMLADQAIREMENPGIHARELAAMFGAVAIGATRNWCREQLYSGAVMDSDARKNCEDMLEQ